MVSLLLRYLTRIARCLVYNRSRNNKFFATSQGLLNQLSGIKRFIFKNFLNERLRKSVSAIEIEYRNHA